MIRSVKRAVQRGLAGILRVPGVRQGMAAAARSGVLPRGVWRRWPVTGSVLVAVTEDVTIRYESRLMDFLGRELFFAGPDGWEPEILRVLPGLARGSAGILDIGAHTGLFTLIALAVNPAARAVAAEPVLGNAILTSENLRANGLAGRCVLAPVAVSDAAGVVPFDTGPVEVPMTSAIVADAPADAVRVPALTLDLLAAWLPSVELIKIDVEGFEHLVLAGGRATLTKYRPALIIECLAGSRVEEFADLWNDLGYDRFHLKAMSAEAVSQIRPEFDGPPHNYLLSPRAGWKRS